MSVLLWMSAAPPGYTNNKLNHTIEVEQDTATIAKRVFELYATGQHSLAQLRQIIRTETGRTFQKGYLHKLLKNPFYSGFFEWNGERFKGTHPLIISPNMFNQVHAVLDGTIAHTTRNTSFHFGDCSPAPLTTA